jgi:hypothetical protein
MYRPRNPVAPKTVAVCPPREELNEVIKGSLAIAHANVPSTLYSDYGFSSPGDCHVSEFSPLLYAG